MRRRPPSTAPGAWTLIVGHLAALFTVAAVLAGLAVLLGCFARWVAAG